MRESKPEFNKIKLDPSIKIAIIVAHWNSAYNEEMFSSAKEALIESGLNEKNIAKFESPGAFEIPLLSLKLAESKKYNAIICFATVIKGSTYHFEIVANESARGIMDVMLKTGIPVLNGILACNTSEQAEIRASKLKEDKGREIALSAVSLINQILAATKLSVSS